MQTNFLLHYAIKIWILDSQPRFAFVTDYNRFICIFYFIGVEKFDQFSLHHGELHSVFQEFYLVLLMAGACIDK